MEKTLGERLREERERLGKNQVELGDIGGVGRNSQGNYERDFKNPDVAYLLAIANVGVDVMYVLFGQRDSAMGAQTEGEAEVMTAFRSLSPADQAVVRRVATGLAEMSALSAPPTAPAE